MLNTAEATTLFVGERYLELVESIKPNLKRMKHIISVDKPHPGMSYYADLIKTGSPDDIFTEIGDDDMTIFDVYRRYHRISKGSYAHTPQFSLSMYWITSLLRIRTQLKRTYLPFLSITWRVSRQ